MKTIFIPFFIFIMSFNAFSSPTGSCDPFRLTKELKETGMPEGIKSNKTLLLYINSQFGPSAVNEIKTINPFWAHPGRLSAKDIHWFRNANLIGKEPFVRYIVMPFNTSAKLNVLFNSLIVNMKSSIPTMIPIFKNSAELELFNQVIKERPDDIKKLIKKVHSLSDAEVNKQYEVLFNYYITKKNASVGFSLVDNPLPTVHVVGYKSIDGDNFIGDGNEIISSFNFAIRLGEMGLKKGSSIKLDTCYIGCSSFPLKLTRNEIVESVKTMNFHYLSSISEGSFLAKLYQDLNNMYRPFKGNVSGHWGEKTGLKNDVLFIGGQYGEGLSSQITGSDGAVYLSEAETNNQISQVPSFPVNKEYTSLQTPIATSQLLYLYRAENDTYFTVPLTDHTNKKTPKNGLYIYVVPVGRPSLVLLYPIDKIASGEGHTSISRGKRVHFAGEIHFINGEIAYWNNDSGHYRTNKTALKLLPELLEILPENKFNSLN